VFFEARLKTVKDICYDYIKQNEIPAGLTSQYMEIYTKYVIDTYKLNIPTISYSYSYINQSSEKYNEIVLEFGNYLKQVPIEKIIADEACKLYKDKNDMSLTQIESLFENNGYIKKKLLDGEIYLSPQNLSYNIKKTINYCDTDKELEKVKMTINYLLNKGIFNERHVYSALCQCDDDNKIMSILEELVKRDIDYSLQRDIMFFVISKPENGNIIKELIGKGIEVNIFDEHAKTPLMYACECGNLETVKLLMEASEYVIDDLNGTTNLMYACKSGAKDVVQYLLEKGAEVNRKNRYQKTALMYAYQNNDLELMKLLLDNGADPTQKDRYKKSIIEDASKNKRAGTLALVSKYLPNIKIKLSELLRDAENPESVAFLFKNYIDIPEENGRLPLVNLCKSGDFDLAEILIDNGANVNAVDKNYKTPLQYAFEENNRDLMLFLAQNGGDKEMVAWYSCKCNDLQLLIKVLQLGVDIDTKYSNDETLLMLACIDSTNPDRNDISNAAKNSLVQRNKKDKIKHILLEHSMNINQKSDLKINALTYAWVGGDAKTATILIQKGIDISKKDIKGITRKYCGKDNEILKALLERGIKIKQKITDKELQNVVNDIKAIKQACKKDKIDKVTKLLANDNLGYKRIAINKLLGKHMFDSLSKKTRRINLAKKIATELLQKDKYFVQWVVNSKNVKVLDLLLKENLLKKKEFDNMLKLLEYCNNYNMKKMVKDMSTTGISQVKGMEK